MVFIEERERKTPVLEYVRGKHHMSQNENEHAMHRFDMVYRSKFVQEEYIQMMLERMTIIIIIILDQQQQQQQQQQHHLKNTRILMRSCLLSIFTRGEGRASKLTEQYDMSLRRVFPVSASLAVQNSRSQRRKHFGAAIPERMVYIRRYAVHGHIHTASATSRW